jgi:16S rRNA processing protein RimM
VTQQLVALGSVGAPHGLNGELRVKLHNPSSDFLEGCRQIWLRLDGDEHGTRRALVRSCRRSGAEYVLLGLDGVDDRDAAAALRGAELCVPRDALPALAPGEYYLIDLVGMRVVLADGSEVGTVERAIEYPASQVLRVAASEGAFELPMREPYLVEVQVPERTIVAAELDDLERLPKGKGG